MERTACEMRPLTQSMSVMDTQPGTKGGKSYPRKKPRLSFQVEKQDIEAFKALLKLIPGVGVNFSKSVVQRAVVRLGMLALAEKPRSATEIPLVTPEELQARAAAATNPMSTRGFITASARHARLPDGHPEKDDEEEEDSKAPGRIAEVRAAAEDKPRKKKP